MSVESNLIWVKERLLPDDVSDKSVLDIGSKNWDMTIFDYARSLKPKEFLGIDPLGGDNVNLATDCAGVHRLMGDERFDVILCLEVLEHVKNIADFALSAMCLLKIGGTMYLTTRMWGYERHGFPNDYWRFNKDSLSTLFAGMTVVDACEDNENFGVYMKLKKEGPSGVPINTALSMTQWRRN